MSSTPLKRFLDAHPRWSAGLVAACLGITLLMVLWTCRGHWRNTTVADHVYYYDLEAGRLFTAPGAQILPLATTQEQAEASASTGQIHGAVSAVVFGCGGCQEPANRYIGYLMTHNPDVVATLKPQWPVAAKLMALGSNPKGSLIRAFDRQADAPAGPWVIGQSPQGMQIVQQAMQSPCPDGSAPRPCSP